MVFILIQRHDIVGLESHLEETREKFNVMKIFDKSGYSPLHYAAFKDVE